MTPPCAGLHALFDSVIDDDHRKARTLCADCPVIDACRQRLAEARADAYDRRNGPRGTWAGRLVGAPAGGIRNPRALAAEELMFTDAEAARAHAAFNRGDDSPRTLVGERVYQRRMKRRQTRRAVA